MSVSKVNAIALSSVSKLNDVAKASIAKFSSVTVPAASAGSFDIITTNLVQYLDAGNSSSYSGSGTTWSDLTASGVDGTLINSPTYSSSEGGGSFLFDSVDDYVKFPYDDAAPIRIGEDSGEVNLISTGSGTRTYGDVDDDGGITFYAWAKLDLSGANASNHLRITTNSTLPTTGNSSSNAYSAYQGAEVTYVRDGRVVCLLFGAGQRDNRTERIDIRTPASFHTSTVGVSLGDWVNICVVVEDDTPISSMSGGYGKAFTGSIYINGTKATGSNLGNSTNGTGDGLGYRMKYNSSQTDKFDGGAGLARGVMSGGYLAEWAVYNDVLTDAEVLSNFNNTKSRYGY